MKRNATSQWMVIVATLLLSSSLVLAGNHANSGKGNKSLAGPQVSAGATTQPSNMDGQKGPHIGKRIHEMLADLNLTDDQKAKVETILTDFRTKAKAFHEAHGAELQQLRSEIKAAKGSGDQTQMKALMQQLKTLMTDAPKPKDLIASIEGVLTADQKTAFEAKVQTLKAELAQKHQHPDKPQKNNGSPSTAPDSTNSHTPAGGKLNL